ncbi:MAG TPA: hypothetical protein VF548_03770 [Allosphingosinicella sp.]|jgi:hypothetical protein
MNRTIALCLIALAFTACSPVAAGPGTRQPAPAGQRSPIEVVRNDRLVLGPETRICVETTLDPEAKRVVEASGQVLYPRLVEEVTLATASRLQSELHYGGWPQQGPRDRVIPYIATPRDPASCFDRADTIRIWQRIVRGKSRLGYGVRLEAMQGRRAYVLAVERPYAVIVAEEIRGALDYRVTNIPASGPYWDPVRDVAVMADMFILHLLSGSKANGRHPERHHR